MVNYKVQGNVALIEIDNGKVNALSPAVIAAFNECLDKAEADAKAVVFTGSPGILSGGYDLTVMQQGIEAARELVNAGSCLTRRLLAFPYPVVAACNGHAIAKGAFLLLA
ncbi:MAG: enoyl-CoA hydratase-related protein, partial [Cellvibrionaceae bacterium]|nr:enoyl-CoA hydratase-related protein [Cellvibrionaceae bacterium]